MCGGVERAVRNIANLDWHREPPGAGQNLGKRKLWGSELAGEKEQKLWSLLLQELRKT